MKFQLLSHKLAYLYLFEWTCKWICRNFDFPLLAVARFALLLDGQLAFSSLFDHIIRHITVGIGAPLKFRNQFPYHLFSKPTWIRLKMDSPSHMPMLPPIAEMNVVADQTQSCSSVKYSKEPQFRTIVVRSVHLYKLRTLCHSLTHRISHFSPSFHGSHCTVSGHSL